MQKNALTRLTSLYLCLMLTVFLLWPGTSGYAQIAEAKYRLFLWLTGGYCALSVLLWLELALIRRTAAFARPSLAEWLLLGYLLCSLIACLLSPWREETWLGGARHEGLLTIALYVLSFCLVRRFARPAAWMLDVLGAAITLFCAVAVLQLLGKNPFGLYPAGLTYYDAGKAYSGEYIATAGNAGFAAAILCTAIPALLFGAWRLRRWHLLVPAALGLAVAVWMNVSAGLAGLAGSILLTLPLALPKGRARKSAAFAVGGLILLALLGVWLLPNLPGMFGERTRCCMARPTPRSVPAASTSGKTSGRRSARVRGLAVGRIRSRIRSARISSGMTRTRTASCARRSTRRTTNTSTSGPIRACSRCSAGWGRLARRRCGSCGGRTRRRRSSAGAPSSATAFRRFSAFPRVSARPICSSHGPCWRDRGSLCRIKLRKQ